MAAAKSALANATVVAATATTVSVVIAIMTSMAAAAVESSRFDSGVPGDRRRLS
jgi:hypothetical protein